jgi:hypothetical protein
MAHRLRPGLTVCFVEDQAIFLDVERDRYWSAAGAARLIEPLIGGQTLSPDQHTQLVEAGLAPVDAAACAPLLIPSPTHSLVEQARRRQRPHLGEILGVGVSMVSARGRLKRQPLASILEAIAARKALACGGEASLVSAAETYQLARRMVPVAPCCLPDSLGLLDWLLARGLTADLVFGVKLNPFSAHCWLQRGQVVLNDAIDTVRLHTPILIV